MVFFNCMVFQIYTEPQYIVVYKSLPRILSGMLNFVNSLFYSYFHP